MLVHLPRLINHQVSPTAGHRLHLLVSSTSHVRLLLLAPLAFQFTQCIPLHGKAIMVMLGEFCPWRVLRTMLVAVVDGATSTMCPIPMSL